MSLSRIAKLPFVRPLMPILRPAYRLSIEIAQRLRRLSTPGKMKQFNKLHLGAGLRQMDGWANIDLNGKKNMIWDLRKPLPVPKQSIEYIYTEHFIEHITREDGLKLLQNCREVLADEGVLRISTPCLRRLATDYLALHIPPVQADAWNPTTPCAMMNEGMRLWGHQFVYDREELTLLLQEAGFSRIQYMEWGKSEHQSLQGLETRPFYDDLIFEAKI